MKEKPSAAKDQARRPVEETLEQSVDLAAAQLQRLEQKLDSAAAPVRERVLRRFPIVFTLLTTFGVAAVFFGFERIISDIAFLHDRPWLILSLGVVILLATGTLYKVLDRPRR